nr:phosphate acyltransferase [Sedimentibacter sp.]
MRKLEELKKLLVTTEKMKLAVVSAEEENVLIAIDDAFNNGLIIPILIGDVEKISTYASKLLIDISKYQIISANSFEESAKIAVTMVSEGKADFLIKGLLDTSILLKQVLNKEYGLVNGKQLSHVMVYEVPTYDKLLFLTDGGMVTYPDLKGKKDLILNAIEVTKALGYEEIKIACLAAKEKINPKMPATVDAGQLKDMYLNKEFEEGVIVEGPISLDLAVSKESAEIKKYESPVAGDADVLLVPNIEMGNGIGKSISLFGKGLNAGVIMGATSPIVLVSRSDSYESKYYSILLGAIISQYNRK